MKYYLLPAAIDDLCNKIFTVYDAMFDDVKVDSQAYMSYFLDMSLHMFIAKSYTRFSDLLKDVESGRWNIVGLVQVDEEGILAWLEEVNDKASLRLDEVRDKMMLGEDDDDFDIVIIERKNK